MGASSTSGWNAKAASIEYPGVYMLDYAGGKYVGGDEGEEGRIQPGRPGSVLYRHKGVWPVTLHNKVAG